MFNIVSYFTPAGSLGPSSLNNRTFWEAEFQTFGVKRTWGAEGAKGGNDLSHLGVKQD